MIIVAGALYVAPENRAAYLEDCEAVVATARAAPGCLDSRSCARCSWRGTRSECYAC